MCRPSIPSFVCFYFFFSPRSTYVLFYCVRKSSKSFSIRLTIFFSKIFFVCIFLDHVNHVCDKPVAHGPKTNCNGVTGNRYERMARCIMFHGVCHVFKFSGRFGRAHSVFFLPTHKGRRISYCCARTIQRQPPLPDFV